MEYWEYKFKYITCYNEDGKDTNKMKLLNAQITSLYIISLDNGSRAS